MATNVFVSFDHDDADQVNGFTSLIKNPNHPLDFHDHSLKEPVRDWTGKIIKYPPDDARSKPIRDEIIDKFQRASKLVVLVGQNTWQSDWVQWEVDAFYEMKSRLPGETWKRIRGMRLKGCDNARIPDVLLNGRSTMYMSWDPDAIDKWIEQDPNK
ncbi:MAG TPA: TIR domain-containing protein [Dehalococcoidales bacterium]